jgi:hypothetical protein
VGVALGEIMTKLEALQRDVESLTRKELRSFRAWFTEYDWQLWDREIEADSKAGKFDQLSAEALAEFDRGETTEL